MEIRERFSSSIEGALAAGGDPASSPLYVFGPFLALIVPAGVAHVTFGASIWLVVLTVFSVSVMYRRVMRWVPDGTGGTGLSEEEFGPWAAKTNASISFIEYTLTFLVSMSALVTFLADRFALLHGSIAGVDAGLVLAAALSLATGALVVAGPHIAALAFGPATGAVLILLWAMMAAAVLRFGVQLPSFELRAFQSEFLGFTLGGYARILALMTGIEVFANLVVAYDGPPRRRSRLAFRSLTLIMASTGLTMLIVGPAILALADPANTQVSVFTQAMDALLPRPLAYAGTWIGVAVLLSASATAVQGMAHLGHGLSHRNYLPDWLGEANKHGIAERIVWLAVGVAVACFALFGTHEATYLALYAAGVFVLLSMTGWAATKRTARERNQTGHAKWLLQMGGIVLASILTSVATVVVFGERFSEGAWLYFALVPALFASMSAVRKRHGPPALHQDALGEKVRTAPPGRRPEPCTCAASANQPRGSGS